MGDEEELVSMKLEAMALTMPRVAGHPNRVPFEGVLTVVDAAQRDCCGMVGASRDVVPIDVAIGRADET